MGIGLSVQGVNLNRLPGKCAVPVDDGKIVLTLDVLVTTIDALGHFLNTIITAQWEEMGDVGSARYEPALLPPCDHKGFKLQ